MWISSTLTYVGGGEQKGVNEARCVVVLRGVSLALVFTSIRAPQPSFHPLTTPTHHPLNPYPTPSPRSLPSPTYPISPPLSRSRPRTRPLFRPSHLLIQSHQEGKEAFPLGLAVSLGAHASVPHAADDAGSAERQCGPWVLLLTSNGVLATYAVVDTSLDTPLSYVGPVPDEIDIPGPDWGAAVGADGANGGGGEEKVPGSVSVGAAGGAFVAAMNGASTQIGAVTTPGAAMATPVVSVDVDHREKLMSFYTEVAPENLGKVRNRAEERDEEVGTHCVCVCVHSWEFWEAREDTYPVRRCAVEGKQITHPHPPFFVVVEY